MMSKLAVAVLLVGVAHAADIIDTTNYRWWGFTFASDIAGYVNMTLDACAIKDAVAAGNWTKVADLYENGDNSVTSSGLRKYRQWAISQHPGEPTFDMLMAYHMNGTWLDNDILEAIENEEGAKVVGLITIATHFKYMFHEIDAAFTRVQANRTDPSSGAPHALDEGWALYAGGTPDQCTSLYDIADELGVDMGTTYAGHAHVNWAVTAYFNDMQYSTLTGNSTTDMFNMTLTALHTQVSTMLAQGVLREAYAAEVAQNCNKTELYTSSIQMAESYWSVLAPQLYAWGASMDNLMKVEEALTADMINYQAVRRALIPVLGRVNTAALGAPRFAEINTDSDCRAI